MSYLVWLVPIAILMGITSLAAFLWSLREGQYEDLDGAAVRILINEDEDRPIREGIPAGGQARDALRK